MADIDRATANRNPPPPEPPKLGVYEATRSFQTLLGNAAFLVTHGQHYLETDLVVRVHPDAFRLVDDEDE